jgi:hypothetical protein
MLSVVSPLRLRWFYLSNGILSDLWVIKRYGRRVRRRQLRHILFCTVAFLSPEFQVDADQGWRYR